MREETKIYIIGAGLAGTNLAEQITRKKVFGTVAAFFDDDAKKIGTSIKGIPILGPISEVTKVFRAEKTAEALIAIPSIRIERLQEIYISLKQSGFTKIKILPTLSQVIDGTAHLVQARDINPEDLLGRTPVTIKLTQTLSYLRGKRVLITGAGGSIGSELSRQLLSAGAERVYLFGHGENSIYQICKELNLLQEGGVGEKAIVVPVIGDLKDRDYMDYILGKLNCDVVFHAAAYKHVPLMEENPVAVIHNNVLGTKNLLDACLTHNVKRFVLISTDKAVDPISVYGISKFLSEKLVLEAASRVKDAHCDASYMFVRFGNVLGSRGSIFPLFVEQIQNGGPVTVTDKRMERYFMTIPEACSLILQTAGVGENATPYLLEMGKPVKIYETAQQLIRYMGYDPEVDIKIKIIGMRPGERLSEILVSEDETTEKTEYPKILKIISKKQSAINGKVLSTLLETLLPICTRDRQKPEAFRDKEYLLSVLKQNFAHYANTVQN